MNVTYTARDEAEIRADWRSGATASEIARARGIHLRKVYRVVKDEPARESLPVRRMSDKRFREICWEEERRRCRDRGLPGPGYSPFELAAMRRCYGWDYINWEAVLIQPDSMSTEELIVCHNNARIDGKRYDGAKKRDASNDVQLSAVEATVADTGENMAALGNSTGDKPEAVVGYMGFDTRNHGSSDYRRTWAEGEDWRYKRENMSKMLSPTDKLLVNSNVKKRSSM